MLDQLDLSVLKPSLPFLWTGLKVSATLTLLAMARLGKSRPLTAVASAYVNLMRSIPLLMVILWFFLVIPLIIGKPIGAEYSALITFTAFEAAYYSEIMRAGIQSVAKGQVMAGYP